MKAPHCVEMEGHLSIRGEKTLGNQPPAEREHRANQGAGQMGRTVVAPSNERLRIGEGNGIEWQRSQADWVQKTKSGEYRDYCQKFYENRRNSLAQL